MKLEWRETWHRVSRSSSRVSPRAGATIRRGVDGGLSVSGSDGGPSKGVDGTGVPPLGEFVTAFCDKDIAFGAAAGGGASRSIVNARKSSCWSFNFGRMVSNIVAMVRRDVWRTTG